MKVLALIFVVYSILLIYIAVGTPIGFSVRLEYSALSIYLKLNHIGAFFLHTVLAHLLFSRSDRYTDRAFWLAPLAAFTYGLLIEFIQLFLPHRDGTVIDLVYNLLGILSFVILFRGYRFLKEVR